MSARDDLIRVIRNDVWYFNEAEDLIDAFAHELAEKIRKDPFFYCMTGAEAADLVDPEVE